MATAVGDQVVAFFEDLFGRVFSDAFRPNIHDVLRRKAVIRQVDEAADAASQSLTRFFRNQQLTEQQAANILEGFASLSNSLTLEQISNPNVTPEAVVKELLEESLSIPEAVRKQEQESVYRVALHTVVQVLMLVGPVMREWEKLHFSSTFELLRRVVARLNEINDQLDTLSRSGESAADERFELTYRDYLFERFHRVETGTVQMTTNQNVDLRELFVMPRVLARTTGKEDSTPGVTDESAPMDLAAARKYFGERSSLAEGPQRKRQADKQEGLTALAQISSARRNVIIGAPGSGKSTFLEWLQLKVASVEQELVLAEKQAIPLLLRVRQLDPHNLPTGPALIEKATASRDRANLMPSGWIERQMKSGRVLLMLDGLDETEPELRDGCILPWLHKLCLDYPNCGYLVSSRPVGYPVGALRSPGFVECDLLDFGTDEIGEYTRHWCTAIRLARNEPEEEARREGEVEGIQILESFKGHPHISNLARNPLMLSAVCLVNYFEGGQLPRDRAVLYRLCVEGLLHHWDHRRGIRSEFTLNEKLRVCREVALAMQSDDRAEYEADKLCEIFEEVLNDEGASRKLLEHVRYRTGLLLERRPGVFAFAHLTFQEYLAARSVYEGNLLGIDAKRLVSEHADPRWKEVIALYCGLAPASAAIAVIKGLVNQPNSDVLSSVLAEAYLSCGAEVHKDSELRTQVLERIACAPGNPNGELSRFSDDEIAPIANRFVGCTGVVDCISESYWWLQFNPQAIQERALLERLKQWRDLNPFDASDLIELLHKYGSNDVLQELSVKVEMYESAGPKYLNMTYPTQAEIAALGLQNREIGEPGVDAAFLQTLRVILKSSRVQEHSLRSIGTMLEGNETRLPNDSSTWPEVAAMLMDLATRVESSFTIFAESRPKKLSTVIDSWIDRLKRAIRESEKSSPAARKKSTESAKRTNKKLPRRRKP
jgi:hypothetical protein